MLDDVRTQEDAPTFLTLGRAVMAARQRRGIKGIEREWSRFRNHLETANFANMPIAAISQSDIERWIEDMRLKETKGGKAGIKKIAGATIQRAIGLCRQIFSAAVEQKLIRTTPFADLDVEWSDEERRSKDWEYLTLEEQQAIASCEEVNEFDRLTVLFAIGTGLSAGEQFHLRLADLDHEAAPPQARVRIGAQGRAKSTERTVMLLGPAEPAARRIVELLPSFAPENPLGLVFPTVRGNLRQQGKPLGKTHALRTFLRKAGIHRDIRWIDLRHTCAVSMAQGWWGQHYGVHDVQRELGLAQIQYVSKYQRFFRSGLDARSSDEEANEEHARPKVSWTAAADPAAAARADASTTSPDRPRANVDYSLGELARDVHKKEEEVAGWARALARKRQLIFAGPPGTGKTFCAHRLARHMVAGGTGVCELVQFHPSYGYEDFVQGIRPQPQPNGSLAYPLEPGLFVEFCRRADGRGKSVLVIDEINRANLSRVFGELLYLLEYRDQTIALAGGNSFKIPENVMLIGTMNTADRSIAVMDHALRRRFAFFEFRPDLDTIARFHAAHDTGFDPSKLLAVLEQLNRTIGDEHYAVGVSFFLDRKLAVGTVLEDVWKLEIEPYLSELFFDEPAKLAAFRWDEIRRELQTPP